MNMSTAGKRGKDAPNAIKSDDLSVLERYLNWAESTLFYKHHGEHNAPEFTYVSLGLAGEAGEAADEIKKIIRICGQRDDPLFDQMIFDPAFRDPLIKELGDTFYYLIRMAKLCGLTLEELAIDNCTKLCARHKTPNPFEEKP